MRTQRKAISLPRKPKPESPIGEWVNTAPAFGLLGFRYAYQLRDLIHSGVLEKGVHYRQSTKTQYQFHLENMKTFLDKSKLEKRGSGR